MNEISVREAIESIKDRYLANNGNSFVTKIKSDYRNNYGIAKEYEKRQILEMLQNADDAMAGSTNDEEHRVLIELNGNVLSICNTGEPFLNKSIFSMTYQSASDKEGRIGSKGLGFRSLLNWCQSIKIETEQITAEYSSQIAKDILFEYYPEMAAQQWDEIKKIDNVEVPISILALPKITEGGNPGLGFATKITVICKDSVEIIEDVKEQLESIEYGALALLPNIRKIDIKINGKKITFTKCVSQCKKLDDVIVDEIIITSNINSVESVTNLYLYKKEGVFPNGKRFYISVGIDPTNTLVFDKLYNFFPTACHIPVPLLLHGSFNLDNSRNGLSKEIEEKKFNIDVLNELIDLASDSVADFYGQNQECNYEGFNKLFCKRNARCELYDLTDIDIKCFFNNKLKDLKLIPTLGGRYTSINKRDAFYSCDGFSSLLNKEDFYDLILRNDDSEIEQFLSDFGFYDIDEFTKRINDGALNNKYSLDELCKIIKIISDSGKLKTKKNSFKLLLDENNNIINDLNSFIFIGDEHIKFDKPSWSKIIKLNKRQYEELKIIFEINDDSEFIEKFSNLYDFRIFTSANVISCLSQLGLKNKNNDQVSEILRLTWNFFKNDKNFSDNPSLTKIKAISKNGTIMDVSCLFLGSEFENPIIDCLFSNSKEYIFNPKASFSDEIMNDSDFSRFIKEFLGIKKLPRLTRKKDGRFLCTDLYINEHSKCNLKSSIVYYNDFFDDILKDQPPENILAWIALDDELTESVLHNNELHQDSMIDFYYGPKFNYINMQNFFKFSVLNTVKVNSKRFDDLCFKDSPFESTYDVINIDYERILSLANCNRYKKLTNTDIDDILIGLGVKGSINTMTPEEIYTYLLELPKIDVSCKLGASFYEKINAKYNDKNLIKELMDDSKNKGKRREFFENGKLLANGPDGLLKYYPVKEVVYSDNLMYNESIKRALCFLALHNRAGQEEAKDVFGITPVSDLPFKIVSLKIDDDFTEKFNKEWSDIVRYIIAIRTASSDISKLTSVHFKIVKELSFSLNGGNDQELSNCDYLVSGDNKEIFISCGSIDSFEKLRIDYNFRSSFGAAVCTLIRLGSSNEVNNICKELLISNENERLNTSIQLTGNRDLFKEIEKIKVSQNEKEKFLAAVKDINNDIRLVSLITNDDDFAKINFDNLEDISSLRALKTIINRYSLDFAKISSFLSSKIDFTEINKQELDTLFAQYINQLKRYRYDEAKNKNNYLIFYKSLSLSTELINIPNSYNFDANKELLNLFNIDSFELLSKEYDFSIKTNNAVKSFSSKELETYNKLRPEKKLCYALFEECRNIFEKEIEEEEINERKKKTPVEIAQKTVEDNQNPNINILSTSITIEGLNDSKNGGGSSSGGSNGTRIKTKEKEYNGLISEQRVFNKLRELEDEGKISQLKWVSGNAYLLKMADVPQDNCGYDIKYYDEELKQTVYVEVKSTSVPSKELIHFEISENEYNFAKKHKKNFKIIYCEIVNDDVASMLDLGFVFDAEEGKEKYILKTSHYKFTSKKA